MNIFPFQNASATKERRSLIETASTAHTTEHSEGASFEAALTQSAPATLVQRREDKSANRSSTAPGVPLSPSRSQRRKFAESANSSLVEDDNGEIADGRGKSPDHEKTKTDSNSVIDAMAILPVGQPIQPLAPLTLESAQVEKKPEKAGLGSLSGGASQGGSQNGVDGGKAKRSMPGASNPTANLNADQPSADLSASPAAIVGENVIGTKEFGANVSLKGSNLLSPGGLVSSGGRDGSWVDVPTQQAGLSNKNGVPARLGALAQMQSIAETSNVLPAISQPDGTESAVVGSVIDAAKVTSQAAVDKAVVTASSVEINIQGRTISVGQNVLGEQSELSQNALRQIRMSNRSGLALPGQLSIKSGKLENSESAAASVPMTTNAEVKDGQTSLPGIVVPEGQMQSATIDEAMVTDPGALVPMTTITEIKDGQTLLTSIARPKGQIQGSTIREALVNEKNQPGARTASTNLADINTKGLKSNEANDLVEQRSPQLLSVFSQSVALNRGEPTTQSQQAGRSEKSAGAAQPSALVQVPTVVETSNPPSPISEVLVTKVAASGSETETPKATSQVALDATVASANPSIGRFEGVKTVAGSQGEIPQGNYHRIQTSNPIVQESLGQANVKGETPGNAGSVVSFSRVGTMTKVNDGQIAFSSETGPTEGTGVPKISVQGPIRPVAATLATDPTDVGAEQQKASGAKAIPVISKGVTKASLLQSAVLNRDGVGAAQKAQPQVQTIKGNLNTPSEIGGVIVAGASSDQFTKQTTQSNTSVSQAFEIPVSEVNAVRSSDSDGASSNSSDDGNNESGLDLSSLSATEPEIEGQFSEAIDQSIGNRGTVAWDGSKDPLLRHAEGHHSPVTPLGLASGGTLAAQQKTEMALSAKSETGNNSFGKNIPVVGIIGSSMGGAERELVNTEFREAKIDLTGNQTANSLVNLSGSTSSDRIRHTEHSELSTREYGSFRGNRLADDVWSAVQTFRATSAKDWDVKIRTDQDTQLNLRLTLQDNQLHIQARLENGNWETMAPRWSELQSLLADRGVQLRPLESSNGHNWSQNSFQQFGSNGNEQRQSTSNSARDQGFVEVGKGFPDEPVRSRKTESPTPSRPSAILEKWA
jgi:hypothetical protein